MVKKRFKSSVEITHEAVKHSDILESMISSCKNECLLLASKEFNNLRISEIYLDTTIEMADEIKGYPFLEEKFIQSKYRRVNFYEVVIEAW